MAETPDRIAYVKLCLDAAPFSRALAAQLATARKRAQDLARALAQERSLQALREQGLLIAWSAERVLCHRALAGLVQQPWLAQLEFVPAEQSLRIAASRSDGRGRLVLSVCLARSPAVHVLHPAGRRLAVLESAALDALAHAGRLAELMRTAAALLALELAAQPEETSPALTPELEHAYLSQAAEWLTREPPEAGNPIDPDQLADQLAAQQRLVFILDQQLRECRSAREPGRAEALAAEFDALLQLPKVRGLRPVDPSGMIWALETDAIAIQGILVGEFRVTFDFAQRMLWVHNLTQPLRGWGSTFDHPHVIDSHPCLGNIERYVYELLSSRELRKLAPLMIEYLEGYNEHSPHCRLEEWSVAQRAADPSGLRVMRRRIHAFEPDPADFRGLSNEPDGLRQR